jgi:hypothetical protein
MSGEASYLLELAESMKYLHNVFSVFTLRHHFGDP